MKKAAVPLAVIVILIVLAVFFFIYASGILSEGGILRKSASAVDEVIQKAPGVGDDEINRIEVPQPPKEVSDAFTKLMQTLNIDTSKAPCIANYGGLPDLNGYTIEFLPRTEAGPKYIVNLRGPDGRIADIQYVNPQLCVVAGQVDGKIVAENFYKNWIDCEKNKTCGRTNLRDFKSAKTMIISYDEGFGFFQLNGNRLTAVLDDNSKIEERNNLEDMGKLYKPDASHICFIPTNYISNHDKDGIENGFVDDIKAPSCN